MFRNAPNYYVPDVPTGTREPASTSARSESNLVGTVIHGRYKLSRLLSANATAAVYMAQDVLLKTHRAVKIFTWELTKDSKWLEELRRTGSAIAVIDNPSIVATYDMGVSDTGHAYVVMDLVDGESLSDFIQRTGPLPWHRAVNITIQIASAVEAAHAAGIIHGSISPLKCILIQASNNRDLVKILGFESTALTSLARTSILHTGPVLGRLGYTAPERFSGEDTDARADVYSIGAILFKLITGRLPFDGAPMEIIAQTIGNNPPLPSMVAPWARIPSDLDTLIDRALARRLADRTASMSILRRDLAHILTTDKPRKPYSLEESVCWANSGVTGGAQLEGSKHSEVPLPRRHAPASFPATRPSPQQTQAQIQVGALQTDVLKGWERRTLLESAANYRSGRYKRIGWYIALTAAPALFLIISENQLAGQVHHGHLTLILFICLLGTLVHR